jgi:WD40 repeat protein
VYSPDGKFLASGDLTGFKLWNAQTLEEIFAVETKAQQLAFGPGSRTLFTASTIDRDQAIHIFNRWDLDTRKELPAISVEVCGAPARIFHWLSRDGKTLFVTQQHDATCVRVFDTEAGKEILPRQGHTAALHAVCISPDGKALASGGEDRMVNLWDLASGQIRHTLSAHTAAVCGLAFSPDGKQLASGSRDGTIAIWNVDSGIEVRALHGHARSFSRIQFSPDGKMLAAGGEKGMVKLWDVATGKERSPLPGHTGSVRCIAFSRDGTLLASGGEDKSIQVHNLASGGSRGFEAPSVVNELAFAAAGHTLASVGDAPENSVRLWDLGTGLEKAWQGHTGRVHGLVFSPSAPLLATCGEDGTVRLWDLTGGNTPVHTIGPGPFGGSVRSIAFTPDGCYLATANANGMVYLLRMAGDR